MVSDAKDAVAQIVLHRLERFKCKADGAEKPECTYGT